MDFPKLIAKAWASVGLKNNIPTDRSLGMSDELATYNDGFPSITMTPTSLGGKAPSGKDMNGILHEITAHIVHLNKGGNYVFNSQFAESIGGYDKGAVLISNDFKKFLISLVDKNKVDFNTTDDYSDYWTVIATTDINEWVKPKDITATSTNTADSRGHSHKIDKASTSKAGIVKLNSATDSESENEAATPKAVFNLKALITRLTSLLSQYIPSSLKSDSVNSASHNHVATSFAVKTAYDLAYAKQSPATTLAGYGITDGVNQADFKIKNIGDFYVCKYPGGTMRQFGTITIKTNRGTTVGQDFIYPEAFADTPIINLTPTLDNLAHDAANVSLYLVNATASNVQIAMYDGDNASVDVKVNVSIIGKC